MKYKNHTNSIGSWAGVSQKEWLDWKWQYNNRIQTIAQLAGCFNVTPARLNEWRTVAGYYPFSITPFYFSLMNATDVNDPIRLQCFPDQKETNFSLGGATDPLEEERDMRVSGLVHRYPDRCVALVTNICATYCRHCNRKRMWKIDAREYNKGYLRSMVDYISRSPHVREVIVSGGDPLTMKENTLEWFLRSLRSIPHVEVLRIGSRIPVVMPMRITRQLCYMLHKYRPLWFNTQFNHPNEITPEAGRACEMLLEAGVPVSNQSVLLRGINDSYETMRELLYGLQRISVRPYYLFHCDPVKGTDHFRTDISSGMRIMEKLWKNVSGLCIPQYVYDVPGGKGKFPLHPFSSFPAERLKTDEHFFDKRDKVN
ncbi:MAG TPA: KamA family radical SAM protein [Syntrophales bacterium]|nr:KamA family radical SAM protein [Syntrophales bacterium]